MKSRKKQIQKEALLTVGLYLFYFLWWYYFAYHYGAKEVEHYNYILGLPEWFFYSCVLGLVVVNVLVYIVVKFCFKEIPLDSEKEGTEKKEDKEEC